MKHGLFHDGPGCLSDRPKGPASMDDTKRMKSPTKPCTIPSALSARRIHFRSRGTSCVSHKLWKLAAGSVVLLSLSLLLAACSSSIEAVDVRTAEFDVPPDVEVAIDSGAGGIRLRGESGRDTVTVTATLHSFHRRTRCGAGRGTGGSLAPGRSRTVCRLRSASGAGDRQGGVRRSRAVGSCRFFAHLGHG